MDPDKIKAAFEALKGGDQAAALELLEQIVVDLAVKGAGSDAAAAAEPAAEATAAEDPVSEEPKDEESEAATALSAQLLTLSGKKTPGEAAAFFADLVSRVAKLDEQRAALELSERRALTVRLVKIGAETPASAWEGDPKSQQPAEHLCGDIAKLRARVESLEASRPKDFVPPVVVVTSPVIKLSKEAEAYCKKNNLTPEEFQARKANAVRTQ